MTVIDYKLIFSYILKKHKQGEGLKLWAKMNLEHVGGVKFLGSVGIYLNMASH